MAASSTVPDPVDNHLFIGKSGSRYAVYLDPGAATWPTLGDRGVLQVLWGNGHYSDFLTAEELEQLAELCKRQAARLRDKTQAVA